MLFPKELLDTDLETVTDEDTYQDTYQAKVLKFVAMDEEQFTYAYQTICNLMDAVDEAAALRDGKGLTLH